jgi:hypothetical protein
MIREARNAVKIEAKSGRISQVPIDPTETILAGDMMQWDAVNHRATKLTAAADGAEFCGISDHSNPQATAGSLTSDYTKSYTNLVQLGLVVMIAGAAETFHGWDDVEMITDAQHVTATAVPGQAVGYIDPAWAGSAGKTVAIGDPVKIWLKVPAKYQAFGGRA